MSQQDSYAREHVAVGVAALRSDWQHNFRADALADAAEAAQKQHGALASFTDLAALERAIERKALRPTPILVAAGDDESPGMAP